MLTLEASPMGRLLYLHLGYQPVGIETAQVDGEEEKVEVYALEKIV
jgi:hypothetical protein